MLNLNDQNVIMQIMKETNQKWRDCKRKQYNIYACIVPRGVVFANKLEQPDSYNAMKRILGKYIATVNECRQHLDLVQILSNRGVYQTGEKCVLLCGTAGELWTVSIDKLKSAYRMEDGSPITKTPNGWFTVSRAAETQAQAVGIYIPSKYVGVYQTAWGATLQVNNPNSGGHNMGDVLVVPTINGNINLADCSPTNNTVFARTYDLSVGGWGRLGIKADSSAPFTLEDCKKLYKVPEEAYIMYSFQSVLNELSSKENLIPKMQCGYYDLAELDTVWFEPVQNSQISHLYKDFYAGVLDHGDYFYVLFRSIVGNEFDFDIQAPRTLDGVKKCLHDVLSVAKQGYQDYVETYKFLVSNYGDKDDYVTGEIMEDAESIKKVGLTEGRYIGLSKNILSHMAINNTDSDAYMAVRLSFDKTDEDYMSRIEVWLQGDTVCEVEKALGKNLHCKADNLQGIKKRVTAMMNAIQKL